MRDWEGDLGGLVEGDNEDRDHDVEQHEGRDGGKRNEVDLCTIVSVAMSGMSDMSAIDIAMYGTGAFHAEGKWARGYETGRLRGAQGRGLRQGALHLRQPGGSASGSTWRSVVRVIVERPAVHHLGCLCPTCALSHPQIAARRLALSWLQCPHQRKLRCPRRETSACRLPCRMRDPGRRARSALSVLGRGASGRVRT